MDSVMKELMRQCPQNFEARTAAAEKHVLNIFMSLLRFYHCFLKTYVL